MIGIDSMNGMNLSGKTGMVQPMQMPPTFGQPPTPLIQPRLGTLHFTTWPPHAGEVVDLVGDKPSDAALEHREVSAAVHVLMLAAATQTPDPLCCGIFRQPALRHCVPNLGGDPEPR